MSKEFAESLYPNQQKVKCAVLNQLDRLDKAVEGNGDVKKEVGRTFAMGKLGNKIINANNLILKARKIRDKYLIGSKSMPTIFDKE